MSISRSRILWALKRRAGLSVSEIAKAVLLAPMTVRQHLSVLERDGLVTSRRVRRAVGRPHALYRLTEKGRESFPRSYPLLAERILQEVQALEGDEIEGLSGEQKLDLVFQKMADRLSESYQGQLEGKPLEAKVLWAAELLDQEGGIAEWNEVRGGYRILDYNCPFQKIAETYGQTCNFHLRFLSQLFGLPVVRLSSIADGANFCCYHIPSAT